MEDIDCYFFEPEGPQVKEPNLINYDELIQNNSILDDKIVKLQLKSNSAFDEFDFLGSTSYNIEKLEQWSNDEESSSEKPLPTWKLDSKSLKLTYPDTFGENLRNELKEKANFQASLNQTKKISPEKSENNVSISQDDYSKIKSLNISEEKKNEIIKFYFRNECHPDLKEIRIDKSKTSSGILHELFVQSYKVKPKFEIFPKMPFDIHQPSFLAKCHAFGVLLAEADGFSKSKAKNEVSQKVLEIIAPSIARKLNYHTKSSEELIAKEHEIFTNPEEKIIEEKMQEEIIIPQEISVVEEKHIEDYEPKPKKREKKEKIIEDIKPAKSNFSPKATKSIIFDHQRGLIMNISLSAASNKKSARYDAINYFFEILSEYSKGHFRISPQYKLDPQYLDSCCEQHVFTKLYILHCLVNNIKNEPFEIYATYFEGEYTIYLYSFEVDQFFTFRSPSYQKAAEMNKFFLIFCIYKKKIGIKEIIDQLRSQYEEELNSQRSKTIEKLDNVESKTNLKETVIPKKDKDGNEMVKSILDDIDGYSIEKSEGNKKTGTKEYQDDDDIMIL